MAFERNTSASSHTHNTDHDSFADSIPPDQSDRTHRVRNISYNQLGSAEKFTSEETTSNNNENSNDRRSILGSSVEQRYHHTTTAIPKINTVSASGSTMTPETSELSSDYGSFHETVPTQLFPTTTKIHETIHAQCLLIGFAFMAVWSPNNAMAPNLTQMADTFHMTEAERDLYLGSYCALAVGVFSLPISALFGFMSDFYSRKHLFVACVLGGSVASAWTASSTTFLSLFCARLINGGCMSGSVSVSFSLLGDLFSTEERNAASSGLTAMMGLGLVLGQVFAGFVGPTYGWQTTFWVSSLLCLTTGLFVALWVREPDRGAKEKVLQNLLESGSKYDRQLTLAGFWHAMCHNRSNALLLWQGFFTSLPWGIVFVFLNDFLSQEKHFSVPDATFMVMLFGVGCAIGGIVGGYIGQKCQIYRRSYLPLFMAVTTFLGVGPFLCLLNLDFPGILGYKAIGLSLLAGCIASLPSVNVRPCIINVNPPETRGAALTACNLLVAIGRGAGPCCITSMMSMFHVSRQTSFNVTLTLFWTITAIQLLFLAKTLPEDQDAMEAELAQYAAKAVADKDSQDSLDDNAYHTTPTKGGASEGGMGIETILVTPDVRRTNSTKPYTVEINENESLIGIEECMMTFDGQAAQRSFQFMKEGIRELKDEVSSMSYACSGCGSATSSPIQHELMDDDGILSMDEVQKRHRVWKQEQQHLLANNIAEEDSPLLGVV
eukprot:Nitzschia sp. Nitz4//scaffold163_size50693//33218//35374//NITZ4_006991-RA/size50693-processed-gene-0.49-mRNA-1//-1//CDS//3329538040//1618//frame0